MCLYPKLIINPKYKPNKKNGYQAPTLPDERVKYVPIGCQNCMECRKKKSRDWQARLTEDLKKHKNAKFITLTFSDASIKKLDQQVSEEIQGYERENQMVTIAVRHFMERWRKKYKRTLRHWLVTELGHQGTKNIHIHGIVWTDEPLSTVEQYWQYGYMWKGKKHHQVNKNGTLVTHYTNYVTEKTVGYITKYTTKIDEEHKHYKAIILTSPGIGQRYTTENHDSRQNKYKPKDTNETYRTRTGHKIGLPIYWRNKLYTEQQREQLWLQKLDKQERWICGERISIKQGDKTYYKLLEWYRQKNKRLGYGTDEINWDRKKYEEHQRRIKLMTRIAKARMAA